MKKLIVANWKMNGSRSLIEAYKQNCFGFDQSAVEAIVCPPFPYLADAHSQLRQVFGIGAQDCSELPEGARTGDVSAKMLSDVGARYCILGHSERRAYHAETNSVVLAKQHSLMANDICPILCIGETEVERDNGDWKRVLDAQLLDGLQGAHKPTLVAYEPVWAIGTGRVPSSQIIVETIRHIGDTLHCGKTDTGVIRVLYGGSVDETSAARIACLDGVDGLLVGGASLDAVRFIAMLNVVAETNWDVLRD